MVFTCWSKKSEEEVPVPPKNNEPLEEYRKMEDTSEEVAKIHSIQVSEIDKRHFIFLMK